MASVTVNGALKASGFDAITVDNTAGGVALTATKIVAHQTGEQFTAPLSAVEALITLETAQIRYTLDGTTVDASTGHLLEVGDTLIVQGTQNLQKFRAIRTGSTSGAIKVTYFRKL